MITCRLYQGGELRELEVEPARVSDLIQERGSRVWLDLEDPTDEELALIREEFGLHELAIEDSRHRGQRSKVEFYEGYFFLVLHALSIGAEGELVDSEIHSFAGHRFLITLRYPPAFEVTEVLRRWDRQTQLSREGGAFLLYVLIDEVVDDYFKVIERFEDVSEEIEDQVFGEEVPDDIQARIFRLKREVVQFRRAVMPLREVLDLMREQPGFVPDQLQPYYRDVADHVIRSLEFAENLRELLTALLEAQLSQVSNRLNQVMKQLTSWAAIILVPTLIAGIYGMNFDHIPELHWLMGYPFALGLMVVSAVSLWFVFRRRDWL